MTKLKLISLDLETASINSVGAQALAEALLKDDTILKDINLSNNNIGGAASVLLQAAITHSTLERIGIEGTLVRCSLSIFLVNLAPTCPHLIAGSRSKP